MDKPHAPPLLEARRIHKSYGQGASTVAILNGVDLDVRAGEFVAVLGPSGSGKSTLLNLFGLLDKPTRGEILIGGKPTAHLDEEDRSRLRVRRLGFLFQFDSLLPEFSVLENLLMPVRIARAQGIATLRDREFQDSAREILSRFGIERLASRLPSQLSGGERQRAALSRALINEPETLLADEPTGNLDKENAELVFKDLRRLADERALAVVMATHNEAIARYASRIVSLADGHIKEMSVTR
jgi:lipoprotein-releasing system ATP-binding protein